MRTYRWVLSVVSLAVVAGVAASGQQGTAVPVRAAKGAGVATRTPKPSTVAPAAKRTRAPRPAGGPVAVGTFKELMEAIIDPASDVVFEAVATTETAGGIVEKMPETDAEWQTVLNSALMLREGANLLMLPGRLREVGGAIKAKDQADFVRRARKLRDLADVAVRAAVKKDVTALYEAGEPIDMACDNCHSKYWDLTKLNQENPIRPERPGRKG